MATFVILHHFSLRVRTYTFYINYLNGSPVSAARQTKGLVEVQWSPDCQLQLWSEEVAFLVWISVRNLSNFIWVTLIGSFLDLILSVRCSVPGRRSIGCIGSKIAFFCRMFCLPTCLTGWVNSFGFLLALLLFLWFLLLLFLLTLLFGLQLLTPLFLLPGFFWVFLACSDCFFNRRHWFPYCFVFYSGG